MRKPNLYRVLVKYHNKNKRKSPISYCVVNMTTKEIQSSWQDIKDAEQVAKDLNKAVA